MANAPNANVSISFQSNVSGSDAESLSHQVIDADQPDLDTTFYFQDDVYFRVYKSPGITGLSLYSSDGVVSRLSALPSHLAGVSPHVRARDNVETIREVVMFSGQNTAGVSFPIHTFTGATRISPERTDLGPISDLGYDTVKCSKTRADTDPPLLAAYLVGYTTKFDLCKLSGVSKPAGFPDDDIDWTSYAVEVYMVGSTD